MNIYTHASHSSSTSPKRRSSFAHEITLSEFGKLGHLNDGQWADHVDVEPDELAEKRFRAIWGPR